MRVPEQACQAISPAACRIPVPSSDQRAEGRLQGHLTSTHRSGVNHSLCLLWGSPLGPVSRWGAMGREFVPGTQWLWDVPRSSWGLQAIRR